MFDGWLKSFRIGWTLPGLLMVTLAGCAGSPRAPYEVAPGVFAAEHPDRGLSPARGTQTVTVFRPEGFSDKFGNGVVLIGFRNKLYAQWQSSPKDEDTPDIWVAYSVSHDGLQWSAPRELAPRGSDGRMHSSGGWWTDSRALVAYVNVWPTGFQSCEGGYTEYRVSTDGENWSAPRRVMGRNGRPVEGIIEQDPHALPDGRIVTAFHLRPGLVVAPHYTDDPSGVAGWVRGDIKLLPYDGTTSRELEPSLFRQGRCLVMVFRDREDSYRQLASRSCDRGESWTTPTLTNMPDARAKQSAGNLPAGSAFLVNAVNADRPRIPLVVTFSRDGRVFDRAYLLHGHADLQPLRYPGQYKRPGYHYPKSLVCGGYLYVAYATKKEDLELTRVPLDNLQRRRSPLSALTSGRPFRIVPPRISRPITHNNPGIP
jgi:hypothetical protein